MWTGRRCAAAAERHLTPPLPSRRTESSRKLLHENIQGVTQKHANPPWHLPAFQPRLLETLAPCWFCFPLFCCSFSCARCGLLCTFYIRTTSTQLESSLETHLLKLAVSLLPGESWDVYQSQIRSRKRSFFVGIIGALLNCTFSEAPHCCAILNRR